MAGRRSLVVTMTAAIVVAGTATTAAAASGRTVAIWQMNEGSGARTMIDSSGNGLRGSIGGEVDTGVRVAGATGYRFATLQPDTPPPHPRHLVTVPDSPDLDPGDRDYAVTIRLRTTNNFGNIIQKGQATVAGGSFKLQIPNGIVQCLFRGSYGTVIVSSNRRINDGRWHLVQCARTASGVTLMADGSVVGTRYGRTGWIANSWPLSIGGKTNCDQVEVGCDYYPGDIDYVEIDVR
jgi:hypothetical protein